jgi:putative membrane protein insertion efficiency factor
MRPARDHEARRRPWGKRATAAAAIAPIRLYQVLVSPLLGRRCRYYPTCSAYAVDAIRSFGILRGLVLAGWRLLRCNPWSLGGIDYVEDQRLFRARPDRIAP